MNKIYLVDGENIAPKMLEGFVKKKKLSGKDQIHILYTKNSGNDYKNHKVFTKKKKNTIYLEVEDGKNALDFQLSTYLGYILGVYPNEKTYIIANDRGYEATTSFAKALGRFVKIITIDPVKEEKKVKPEVKVPTKKAKKKKEKRPETIKRANGRTKEDWAVIQSQFVDAKDKKELLYRYAYNLNDLYQNCLHMMGQEKGVAYYQKHKKEFREHFNAKHIRGN